MKSNLTFQDYFIVHTRLPKKDHQLRVADDDDDDAAAGIMCVSVCAFNTQNCKIDKREFDELASGSTPVVYLFSLEIYMISTVYTSK